MNEKNPLDKRNSAIEILRRPVSRLVAGLGMAAALFTVPPDLGTGWRELLEQLGFLLLIAAALGRLWATPYIAGRKTRSLCQEGPYSLTRNPLYFFSFLGVVGFGLAIQNIIFTAVAIPVFLAYYSAVITSEENRLRQVHGTALDEYCERVPRFWPRLKAPSGPEELVMKVAPFARGLHEVFWFLAAIILAEVLETMHTGHVWPTYVLPF